MQRIGVFVCWCGSNIAGTVDVEAVSEALKNEPGVVFSTNYQYMCSQAGQNMIIESVKEEGVTLVLMGMVNENKKSGGRGLSDIYGDEEEDSDDEDDFI